MKNAGFWSMIVGGAIAVGAPAVGALGAALGMVRSFATLGEKGVADPKGLAESVGGVLTASAYGFFVAGFGLVIFFIGLGLWLSAKSRRVPPPLPGA